MFRIAIEITRRLGLAGEELPSSLEAFVDRHRGGLPDEFGILRGQFFEPVDRRSDVVVD
jgi:hypothetical protein